MSAVRNREVSLFMWVCTRFALPAVLWCRNLNFSTVACVVRPPFVQSFSFFCMAGQPHWAQASSFLSCPGHTQTHHTRQDSSGRVIGLVAKTTRNTHKRQTSMPAAGCEPAILASEPPQPHTLDRADAGIGLSSAERSIFPSVTFLCKFIVIKEDTYRMKAHSFLFRSIFPSVGQMNVLLRKHHVKCISCCKSLYSASVTKHACKLCNFISFLACSVFSPDFLFRSSKPTKHKL